MRPEWDLLLLKLVMSSTEGGTDEIFCSFTHWFVQEYVEIQYKRKTHGFRTFTYFGPYVWNSLPQHNNNAKQLFHLLKQN